LPWANLRARLRRFTTDGIPPFRKGRERNGARACIVRASNEVGSGTTFPEKTSRKFLAVVRPPEVIFLLTPFELEIFYSVLRYFAFIIFEGFCPKFSLLRF